MIFEEIFTDIHLHILSDIIIPYNPKYYDAASKITEGIAALTKHLCQHQLFTTSFLEQLFLLLLKTTSRKPQRKLQSLNCASFPQNVMLENTSETNTASFLFLICTIRTASIQGLPQHAVTATLNSQSQRYHLSSMSASPNYSPKSFDLFKSFKDWSLKHKNIKVKAFVKADDYLARKMTDFP